MNERASKLRELKQGQVGRIAGTKEKNDVKNVINQFLQHF